MTLYMAVLYMASVQRKKKETPLETQHQKGPPQLHPLTPLQMVEFEMTEDQIAVGTGRA